MVSGRTIHSRVTEKVREAENEVDGFERDIFNTEKKIGNLSEVREKAYTALADIYSPELTPQALTKVRSLPDVQRVVNQAFAEKQARREQVESLMKGSKEGRIALEERLSSVMTDLESSNSQAKDLRKKAVETLGKTVTYVEATKSAQAQEEVIQTHSRLAEEVKVDAKGKLPAYENNKLFMYLVDGGFNPKERHSGIIGKVDSWVANIIGFAEQKASYDHLVTMPELMANEVAQRKEVLENVLVEIKKQEGEVAQSVGLITVNEKISDIATKRRDIELQIAKLDNAYDSYCAERKEMDSAKDPYHAGLTEKLKGILQDDSLEQLKERARLHPGTEDDQLVYRIEEIEGEIKTLKLSIREIKARRDESTERLSGLKTISRKTGNYTSSDDYYSGSFDIDSLLTGYILGKHSASSVASTVESSHKVKEPEYTPTYHHSSSSSSWGSGSSSWGGGGFSIGGGLSGGGGFSSGGGFSGGGFSSGKGF